MNRAGKVTELEIAKRDRKGDSGKMSHFIANGSWERDG